MKGIRMLLFFVLPIIANFVFALDSTDVQTSAHIMP